MDDSDSEADSERRRKHLLVGDSVEVFQTEVELRGSWQPAEVVLVRPGRRGIRYSALHARDGTPFVESIPVSSCVDGQNDPEPTKPLRLCIRPHPPVPSSFSAWKKGMYVDAFHENAWWEAVLLENASTQDLSLQVRVFLADRRQEKQVMLENLRVSQHWNEWTGSWCVKGQLGHDLDCKLIMVAAPKKIEDMRKDYFSFPRRRLLNLNAPAPTRRSTDDTSSTVTRQEVVAQNRTKSRMASNGKHHSADKQHSADKKNSRYPSEKETSEDDSEEEQEDDTEDTDAVSQLARGKYTKASWENAKKLLKNHGWGISSKMRPGSQRKDTYYTSPAGVCYRSLPAACREWSRLHPPSGRNLSQTEQFMHDKGQKCSNQQPEVNLKKRTMSLSDELVTPRRKCDTGSDFSRLGSSLRPKNKNRACMEVVLHDAGEKSQVKRTVLSWLVDMNVLKDNEPVTYVNRKTKEIMLQGRAKADGLVCNCCNTLWTLSTFEAHAGSKLRRPCANIFLSSGQSLSDLQMEALAAQDPVKKQDELPATTSHDENDDTCGVCGDGGQLICCDHCPSTFHLHCLLLENVPEGEWYCPCCRCAICGGSEYNGDDTSFNEMTVLLCDQCEREYHVGCMYGRGMPKMERIPEDFWFCSPRCNKIYRKLRGLVGVSHEIENELSWTLLRCAEGEVSANREVTAEHRSKLAIALCVMRECFNPMIDPRTKIDLVSHILYNRGKADITRLNFRGFYTIILERDDEIISVAAIRVHGGVLAEMPLIGTRFQHRRQGMCRRLVRAIEELLRELGVQYLALPAVNELLPTWINAFHFDRITPTRRLEFVQRNVVFFPGVTLLQKHLLSQKSPFLEDDLSAGRDSDLLESFNFEDDSDTDDMKFDEFRTTNGSSTQVNGFPNTALCEVSTQEQNPDIPFAMRPAPWRPVIGGEAYLIDGLPQTIGSGGVLIGKLAKNKPESRVKQMPVLASS